MDTAAYLSRQGWRGDGHALHHSGRGLTKPIRISQKTNVYGIGKKKHDAHADQWWARAFDDTLKGLNTTNDNITGKVDGINLGAGSQALQMVGRAGAKWVGQSGLYRNFVRGESLSGTLTPEEGCPSKEDDHSRVEVVGVNGRGATMTSVDTNRKKRRRDKQENAAEQLISIAGEVTAEIPGTKRRRRDYVQNDLRDTQSEEERRRRRKEKKAKKALLVTDTSLRGTSKNNIMTEEKAHKKPTSLSEGSRGSSDGTDMPARRKKRECSKHTIS